MVVLGVIWGVGMFLVGAFFFFSFLEKENPIHNALLRRYKLKKKLGAPSFFSKGEFWIPTTICSILMVPFWPLGLIWLAFRRTNKYRLEVKEYKTLKLEQQEKQEGGLSIAEQGGELSKCQ